MCQNPPFPIRSLAKENIFVTGFVKNIREEYLKSVMNVAPMRFGAGKSNKINESLILGVPVVATPIAVEGFPDELKKIIDVAAIPGDFANQIVKYLKTPELRRQFMELDKTKIKEMLSWENIVSQFENDLREELEKNKII